MRTSVELSSATWCKSSYSNSNGGECVEVNDSLPGVVPVRDSKNPHLPPIVVPAAAWAVFVGGLKA